MDDQGDFSVSEKHPFSKDTFTEKKHSLEGSKSHKIIENPLVKIITNLLPTKLC